MIHPICVNMPVSKIVEVADKHLLENQRFKNQLDIEKGRYAALYTRTYEGKC